MKNNRQYRSSAQSRVLAAIVVACTAVLETAIGHAAEGHSGGNGGDVATCTPSTTSSFRGDYMADYLLTYRQSNHNEDVVAVESWSASLARISKVLNEKAPELARSFDDFTADIGKDASSARKYTWEEAAFGLIYLDDQELTNLVPKNCYKLLEGGRIGLHQAVIRHDNGHSVEYQFDYEMVSKLKTERPLQYSFLMVHEWLWNVTGDVRLIRKLNRFLHSRTLETMNPAELKAYFAKYQISTGWVPEIPPTLVWRWSVGPNFSSITSSRSDSTGPILVSTGYGDSRAAGFIDHNGSEIISPDYAKVYPFSEGRALVQVRPRVRSRDPWEFIDLTGKKLDISTPFSEALSFSESLAAVKVTDARHPEGAWGFINPNGKMVIAPQFEDADSFIGGLALVAVKNSSGQTIWGYINPSGSWGIRPVYTCAGSFSYAAKSLAVACVQDAKGKKRVGLINKSGQFIIQPKLDILGTQDKETGLIAAGVDHKYGFIDINGNWVIQPRFSGLGSFSEGLAAVYLGELIGYADTSGQVKIEPRYGEASEFRHGIAAVSEAGSRQKHFIDLAGNPLPSINAYSATPLTRQGIWFIKFACRDLPVIYATTWSGYAPEAYRAGDFCAAFVDRSGNLAPAPFEEVLDIGDKDLFFAEKPTYGWGIVQFEQRQ